VSQAATFGDGMNANRKFVVDGMIKGIELLKQNQKTFKSHTIHLA